MSDPLDSIMSMLRNKGSVDPATVAARGARIKEEARRSGGPAIQTAKPQGPVQQELAQIGQQRAAQPGVRDITQTMMDQLNESIISLKIMVHNERDPMRQRELEQMAAQIRQQITQLGGVPIRADQTIEEGLSMLRGQGVIGAPQLNEQITAATQGAAFQQDPFTQLFSTLAATNAPSPTVVAPLPATVARVAPPPPVAPPQLQPTLPSAVPQKTVTIGGVTVPAENTAQIEALQRAIAAPVAPVVPGVGGVPPADQPVAPAQPTVTPVKPPIPGEPTPADRFAQLISGGLGPDEAAALTGYTGSAYGKDYRDGKVVWQPGVKPPVGTVPTQQPGASTVGATAASILAQDNPADAGVTAPGASFLISPDKIPEIFQLYGIQAQSEEQLRAAATAIADRATLGKAQVIEREIARMELDNSNEFVIAKRNIDLAAAGMRAEIQEEVAARGIYYSSVMSKNIQELDAKVIEQIADISAAAAARVADLRGELKDLAQWDIVEEEVQYQQLRTQDNNLRMQLAQAHVGLMQWADQMALDRFRTEFQIFSDQQKIALDKLNTDYAMARNNAGDAGVAMLSNDPIIRTALEKGGVNVADLQKLPLATQAAAIQGIMSALTWNNQLTNVTANTALVNGQVALTAAETAAKVATQGTTELEQQVKAATLTTALRFTQGRLAAKDITPEQRAVLESYGYKIERPEETAKTALSAMLSDLGQRLVSGQLDYATLTEGERAGLKAAGFEVANPTETVKNLAAQAAADIMMRVLSGDTTVTPLQLAAIGVPPVPGKDPNAALKEKVDELTYRAAIKSAGLKPGETLSDGEKMLLGQKVTTADEKIIEKSKVKQAQDLQAAMERAADGLPLSEYQKTLLGIPTDKPDKPVLDASTAYPALGATMEALGNTLRGGEPDSTIKDPIDNTKKLKDSAFLQQQAADQLAQARALLEILDPKLQPAYRDAINVAQSVLDAARRYEPPPSFSLWSRIWPDPAFPLNAIQR